VRTSITARLYWCFAVILISVAVVGVWEVLTSLRIARRTRDSLLTSYKAAIAVDDLHRTARSAQLTLSAAARTATGSDLPRVLEMERQFSQTLEVLKRSAGREESAVAVEKKFRATMDEGMAFVNATVSERWVESGERARLFDRAADELEGALGAFRYREVTAMEAELHRLNHDLELAAWVFASGLSLSLIVAIAFALSLRRALVEPLSELTAISKAIAEEGDLSTKVPVRSDDELGQLATAFGDMVRRLQEMSTESQRLVATRTRLENELDIASRLQTALLPRDSCKIRGVEISARMVPATEVGGDYYDVLELEDGCWLGVGDVSGHGLTAGLIMMMMQSVVAGLGRHAPNAAPRQLVNILNKVIFDNVRSRLSKDEHATFCLIRYRSDGSFTFAGAHEAILIWRERQGRCEVIETPGTWLGGIEDIEPFVTDSDNRLEPGDVMLLYTDGLVEAMDRAGIQFGVERLCKELEKVHSAPADAIRDHMIAAVGAFMNVQQDDITVLVLRHVAEPAQRPVPGALQGTGQVI